ncbi:MAG: SMC-Scp complex subunit ScpB [Lachnospiraceae bacterium]|nr:SMC-Scp complex subunit ScpB [Lachnospiraceae bacterium]
MTREAILEGILFAMGGSVEREQLAEAMEITPEEVEEAAAALKAKYEEEERGIRLIRLDSAYQLCSAEGCYDTLIKLASKPKQPVLTDVVRETLAIIAYKQPVTKGDIERIRGVSSDHAVNRLVEFGLVEEKGRLNAPGRPLLFGTTEEFLRRFRIEGCEVLPELDPDQMAEIEAQVENETAKAEATEREEQEKIKVEI